MECQKMLTLNLNLTIQKRVEKIILSGKKNNTEIFGSHTRNFE